MCPIFNTGQLFCFFHVGCSIGDDHLHCIQNIVLWDIYITRTCGENTHIVAMPSNSSTIVDRILEYTMEAATGLQEIAGFTHIPFLERTCTLALTIVPMMQVRMLTGTGFCGEFIKFNCRTPNSRRSDASELQKTFTIYSVYSPACVSTPKTSNLRICCTGSRNMRCE
jgi:hypothetical protein